MQLDYTTEDTPDSDHLQEGDYAVQITATDVGPTKAGNGKILTLQISHYQQN